MMNFMPDDLHREHRQLLRKEAEHARLVNLARQNKHDNVNRHRLSSMLRRVNNSLAWLWRRSPDVTASKTVAAR